jgi:hypothetical protein
MLHYILLLYRDPLVSTFRNLPLREYEEDGGSHLTEPIGGVLLV